jgi:hypothetical protein
MANYSNRGSASVYLMQSMDLFKIGVARNVKSRLAAIRGSNPHNVKLITSIELASEESAYCVEHQMHHRFLNERVHLEWFRIKEEDFHIASAQALGDLNETGAYDGVRFTPKYRYAVSLGVNGKQRHKGTYDCKLFAARKFNELKCIFSYASGRFNVLPPEYFRETYGTYKKFYIGPASD